MRAVVGLLLVCCGLVSVSVSVCADPLYADSSNTFHITDASTNIIFGWYFANGTGTLLNPNLSMTIGTTYYISIDFDSSDSGLLFGVTQRSNDTSLGNSAALGLVPNNTACGTGPGYQTQGGPPTPACVMAFTPNATSPQPLYYHEATYAAMTGQIFVVAPTTLPPTTAAPTTLAPTTVAPTNNTNNATTTAPTTVAPTNNTGNATTSPPTTTAPTTPAPVTPVTGGTLVGPSFRITGNTGATAFLFTGPNGTLYSNPTLNVTAGSTLTFSLEYATFHPLGFSNNSDPTAFTAFDFPDGYQDYTLNAAANCNTSFSAQVKTVRMATFNITNPQPCVITIKVPTIDVAAPILYYRCARHFPMIGTINVVAPAASGTTAPPAGTTAPPKSSATATTVSVFGTGMALLVVMFAMLLA